MRKKINLHLVGIASIAILLTLTMVTYVFYDIFKHQVMKDLKIYSDLLISSGFYVSGETFDGNLKMDHMRITVVDSDGKVVYDSSADVSKMGNHKDRNEIKEAFKKGSGQAIRTSQTLDTSSFYYAAKVNDHYVIRVGREASSIYSVFKAAVPSIMIILIILFVFCAILARLCTKSVIEPIENMTAHMDELQNVPVYKEMKPFVDAISSQHKEIMSNANMRQEFTANVSHELKTPLASISGYSELIKSGMATGDDVKHFAEEIHRNAKRLLALINDIIKLSQLDSFEFQMKVEPVNLYEIAVNCKELLTLHGEELGVTVSVSGNDVEIPGGKSAIEEMVYNLCDNGIRYNNPGGKVTVTVSEDSEYGYLIVEDDGIGISKEDQKRIFERFYRVDKSRSKETGGTGLGLAIVKHIAMNHNAKIEIESELGKGTRIEVAFPKER
ncbi:MAG TPA: two-component sensor histidine kinase [Lachnospiraceae bacterium]|nr:ATP-binding protein [uncultured Lachnoclostridium sp.]HAU88523.1 two-component sensor histidine kinase [Lachnospiraceae bacterium]